MPHFAPALGSLYSFLFFLLTNSTQHFFFSICRSRDFYLYSSAHDNMKEDQIVWSSMDLLRMRLISWRLQAASGAIKFMASQVRSHSDALQVQTSRGNYLLLSTSAKQVDVDDFRFIGAWHGQSHPGGNDMSGRALGRPISASAQP